MNSLTIRWDTSKEDQKILNFQLKQRKALKQKSNLLVSATIPKIQDIVKEIFTIEML